MPRYFTHVNRFLDDTAYIIIDDDGEARVRTKYGTENEIMISLEQCEENVKNGDWIEVSAEQLQRDEEA